MNTPDKKPDRQPASRAGGDFDSAAEVDMEYTDEWLSAYLDDELNPGQRAIVEQRLVVDTEAAELLKDLERVRGLVGSLPAWLGNDVPWSLPTGLQPNSSADEASQTDLINGRLQPVPETEASRIEGDYHNELQPAVHATSHTAGLTERVDKNSLTLESRTGPRSLSHPLFPGWSTAWSRSLSLAACVLLAVGVGWYLWSKDEPRSVATSSGTSNIAGRGVAESKSEGDMTAELFFEAERAAAEPATTSAFDFSPEAMSRGQDSLESGRRRAEGQEGLSAPGGAAQAKAFPLSASPAASDLSAASDPTAANASGLTLPAAPLPSLSSPPNPAASPLVLAHSSAWTPGDIRDGLARLAPLLNISVPFNESALAGVQGLDIQASTRSADSQARAESAPFPVAIVAREKSNGDVSQLVSLLMEPEFGLVGLGNGTSQPPQADMVPLAADSDSPATMVALFVTYGQAENILEKLRGAGEVSGSVVWITAAAAANQPPVAAQKVVVVLTPK